MDMALHLGMTETGLRRGMTERELRRWSMYAERRMLPMRRIELLLAQIALTVAQAMGGAKNAALSDFLFDPETAGETMNDADEPADVEDLAAFFGATVVKRGD